MDRFVVQGGAPLEGELPVSGAKNSALPALAACLLTAEPVVLGRIPTVRDVQTMQKLLVRCGASVHQEGGRVRVEAAELGSAEAPYDLVKTMRASSLVLGPLVARCGRARVSLPGGCAIGARPINLHLGGLERLGARIRQAHGYVEAEAPNGLGGATVHFDRITVTGTEDLLMAAVLAEGETVLENAAREPEVADLAALLNKMGASIEGAGTSTVRVRGVKRLHGAEHAIIPDRIETGTFMVAGAITRGDVRITGCAPEHVSALTEKLRQAGADVSEVAPHTLRVRASGKLVSANVTTEEYPGFATDLQAQYMALMTQADGVARITETIFENRFMHALELVRMGANIRVEGHRAVVAGPSKLGGAAVIASDLRASASLVLAALVAQGETVIDRVYHIDRGYEDIEQKLGSGWSEDPPEEIGMSAEHKKHNPGFLALVDDAKSRIRQVKIDDLARMLAEKEQFVLVDVREESEWAAGHPAGAIHLSKGIIEREIETVAPDKGTKMVLCCGGGYRSALSADSLQKMGYINAVSLDGGWRAYQAAGLPVEK